MRLPFLVWCSQLCLVFSHIAGFFKYQQLWKESSGPCFFVCFFFVFFLFFFHGDGHEGKVVFLTLPLLVGCNQVSLWANNIRGFFGCEYLRKKSIHTFVWLLSIFVYFLAFVSSIAGFHQVMTSSFWDWPYFISFSRFSWCFGWR